MLGMFVPLVRDLFLNFPQNLNFCSRLCQGFHRSETWCGLCNGGLAKIKSDSLQKTFVVRFLKKCPKFHVRQRPNWLFWSFYSYDAYYLMVFGLSSHNMQVAVFPLADEVYKHLEWGHVHGGVKIFDNCCVCMYRYTVRENGKNSFHKLIRLLTANLSLVRMTSKRPPSTEKSVHTMSILRVPSSIQA